MSKIKFDEKDFSGHSPLWEAVQQWGSKAGGGDSIQGVEKAVQRLIKKYVKRERKRLARVIPARYLTAQSTPITKDELLEMLKQNREEGMGWPSDFPGKH